MKQTITYLLNKGYTSRETAEKLGVSKKTVLRIAKKHGLEFKNKPVRKNVIDPKVIKKLVQKGYSDIDISKMLKINRSSVNKICLKHSIKRNYKVKLTKKEKALLIGTLLGDASLSFLGKQTRINFEHGHKQEDYCRWKAAQFKNLSFKVKNVKRKTIDKRTNIYYKSTLAFSKSTQTLNKWHKLLYKNKKIIPEVLLEYFNSLSLAVLYMDDGTKCSSSYSLATHCFDKKSLDIFNKMCMRKFGIQWNINKNHQLYLPVKYKKTFEKLVKPYMHPTMMYKLH